MQCNHKKKAGVVIAGLKGGTGKTVISIGIAAAWRNLDISVAPFKKGPDYIDAGWLAQAAGLPCYNLDTFLCEPFQVKQSFIKHSAAADIALVEGNRGLYDGIDTDGHTSTAEIAKLLDLPIVLVLDCTKSTRTMAALLMGCVHFDPYLNIMGVILNQVAGNRHENKVKDNIKRFCNIEVFGSVPKLQADDFPERHMGLVPSAEHALALQSIESAAQFAKSYIDLKSLYEACLRASQTPTSQPPLLSSVAPLRDVLHIHSAALPASPVATPLISKDTALTKDETKLEKQFLDYQSDKVVNLNYTQSQSVSKSISKKKRKYEDRYVDNGNRPVIGIIRDSAFQFYYPDNLEILEEKGAVLKIISPLNEPHIPEVDAIYMGGGFPETHAAQLAENITFKNELKALAQKGLPIYAECGGLIFLGKSLTLNQTTDNNKVNSYVNNYDNNKVNSYNYDKDKPVVYPMADILPLSFGLSKRPVGHGYTEVKVVNENPFFDIGTIIKGHEFRYSHIIDIEYQDKDMAFSMMRGQGIINKKDGFFKDNVFGTYTHILASSTPSWADGIIKKAIEYRIRNNKNTNQFFTGE